MSAAWSEPRIVCGQRCLLVPAQTDDASNSNHPPLVLIGGLAQTILSYESHLPALSKERNVLVYECRGQGIIETNEQEVSARPSLFCSVSHCYGNSSHCHLQQEGSRYANVTLPFQAERLLETVDEVLGDECQFDLVGFSLGGRIAMASACLDTSNRIQRLHLTGVATERSIQGKVALLAWEELIQSDNLQGFAWSALQQTHSSEYLYQNRQRLPTWTQLLCDSNSCAGIQALLQQTHPEDPQDPWHVSCMARRLATKKNVKGQLVVGELDVMAPPDRVIELASILDWPAPAILPNCGHAAPMEAGREWRTSVMNFLNQN